MTEPKQTQVHEVQCKLPAAVLVRLLQIAAETQGEEAQGNNFTMKSVPDLFLVLLAEMIIANKDTQLRKWALHEIIVAVLQNFKMEEGAP